MRLKRGIFIFIVLTLFWFTLLLAFYENYVFLAPSDDFDDSLVAVDSDEDVVSKGSSGEIDTAIANLGVGCTTAWYIDEDCDGYGVGKQSGGQYGRLDINIHGDMPDADDSDPTVNTLQTVIQRYGDPSQNIQNLRNFLIARGYAPNNIFVIDPVNGNDLTAQINSVTHPFRTWGEIICEGGLVGSYPNQVPACERAGPNGHKNLEIQAGDIVLFRGGDYVTSSLSTETPLHNFISGTLNNPIVLMAYPGEVSKIISFNGISPSNSNNLIVDGFISTCEPNLGNCEGNNGLGHTGINVGGTGYNWIFRNNEILRHKWGIWGAIPKDNILIEKNVIHDNSGEHGIYIPNSDVNPMTNFRINKNLVFRNQRHGIQFNGKITNAIVENNIIHSNNLGGITLTNGVQDSVIRNNLIFNNNKQGIILYGYCDTAYFNCNSLDPRGCLVGLVPQCPSSTTNCGSSTSGEVTTFNFPQCHGDGADYRRSNDNNLIVNNLIWVGSNHNGVCDDWRNPPCSVMESPSDFSVIDFNDATPRDVYTFRGNVFRNNIFRNVGAAVFRTDRLNHLTSPGTLIENNLFYRSNGEPAGLSSAVTDGSHSGSYLLGAVTYYTWTFAGFQNHWPNILRNNILGDPLFTDVEHSYALTQGIYNFDPTAQSPSIDRGLSNGAPVKDLRNNPRLGAVDIGAYEYDPIGGGQGNTQVSSDATSTAGIAPQCDAPQILSTSTTRYFADVKIDGRNIVFSDSGVITFYDLGQDKKKSVDDVGFIVPNLLNHNNNPWSVPTPANAMPTGTNFNYHDIYPEIYEKNLVFVRVTYDDSHGVRYFLMHYYLGADGIAGNADDSGPNLVSGEPSAWYSDIRYPRIEKDFVIYSRQNSGPNYYEYYCTLDDSDCQQGRVSLLNNLDVAGGGDLREFRDVGYGDSNSYNGFFKRYPSIYYKNSATYGSTSESVVFTQNAYYKIHDLTHNVLLFGLSSGNNANLAATTVQNPQQYSSISGSSLGFLSEAVIANHVGSSNRYLIAWHDYIAGYGSYPARGLLGSYKVATYPLTDTLSIQSPQSGQYYYSPPSVDENNVVFSSMGNSGQNSLYISECYSY